MFVGTNLDHYPTSYFFNAHGTVQMLPHDVGVKFNLDNIIGYEREDKKKNKHGKEQRAIVAQLMSGLCSS